MNETPRGSGVPIAGDGDHGEATVRGRLGIASFGGMDSRHPDWCAQILLSGRLEDKLAPPPDGISLAGAPTRPIDEPARAPDIAFVKRAAPLPQTHELERPDARARCLARFAHHELMAVELLAWALLRWTDAPAGLRADWLAILRDEQRHARLYLERLAACGSRIEEHPSSDYFWRQARRIARSPAGACAFLAGVGLTLEQANLDFSLLYADAFARAGDAASSEALAIVHRDEIRHVASAARWLHLLSNEPDEVRRYEANVTFPLSAARAKGRRFHAAPRRAAGLGEPFIEHVRSARSSQELASHEPARSGA